MYQKAPIDSQQGNTCILLTFNFLYVHEWLPITIRQIQSPIFPAIFPSDVCPLRQ
ncbi:hypothetical protein VKI22_14115 [Cyanobacterium aponinum UTEX 3221]|uniref:hypothetical protein n=1 Tax=Cyanobacterium aponinum TaxID=379064 RepID=UPI002B4C16D1|nr:hypothetical protein [Cyanobacterium aponinum]WRL37744.1 hypothetical protein VKI22_14115 [Cyanobacterium aponinum UTEX 3221]